VHFAITRELAPEGALLGRVAEGYSDSLLTAVDRCMAADPAQRPHTIDALRHLLGIVSLGPAAPADQAVIDAMDPVPAAAGPAIEALPAAAPKTAMAAADPTPSFLREDAPPRPAGLSLWQRRALAAGGAALLLAVALALFAELRDSGSYDHIVLTLPQSGDQPRPYPAPAPSAPSTLSAPSAMPAPAPLATQDQPPATALPAASDATAPAEAPAAPQAADPARTAQAGRNAGVRGSATYRLRIQPWGVIYVDGVERGVSPPIKRLVLPPGRHTIRIANPNFRERALEVDTSAGNAQIAADFNDEPRQVRDYP